MFEQMSNVKYAKYLLHGSGLILCHKMSKYILYYCNFCCTEVATGGVLEIKVFLEVSQNSQENTCSGVSFLIKLQVKRNSRTGVFL